MRGGRGARCLATEEQTPWWHSYRVRVQLVLIKRIPFTRLEATIFRLKSNGYYICRLSIKAAFRAIAFPLANATSPVAGLGQNGRGQNNGTDKKYYGQNGTDRIIN